jgi:hypothetical protein
MKFTKVFKKSLPLIPAAIAVTVAACSAYRPTPPLAALTPTSAVRPTFYVAGAKPYQAGTAFVTTHANGRGQMLVTALHLLGPDGGLSQQLPAAQLGQRVQRVRGARFADDKLLVDADVAVTNNGYALTRRGDARGDIAAFRVVKNNGAAVLKLAARNPGVGEWVWLVGDEYKSNPPALRPYPARVMDVDGNGLELQTANVFDLTGFSGAPIVNAKSEVVGILIGGDDAGHATAHDVESMRRYLPR